MAQDAPARPKQPLDVLQSMLNAVLIETGRALKGSNKEGGKAQVGATRTQSTIPTIIEQFQQALDDLEIDINDPSNSAIQDSSIDSLFDIPNDNDDNIDMDFDNMDFSFAINSQDQTQTQSNDFDLSTFGNMSQDQNVTNNGTDSFDLDNVGGDDNMDLDLTMFGADDSVFDDMFVDGDDATMPPARQ
ncbi:hypothetical protein M7I_4225 [Glarea lozoyensis 74030]|uniref:Uncharacterized protein n=1 Tax=Glarea lozoyensis (strain ATCC 74030 / MF5533) TaxID=1104152 RepID=H0ENL7_GLAL7|nr:hypothetical protein M7I_4225 [Glarea lozoyensis 74030]